MALIHLSPSLTPRNPTPHMPAVRLYSLSAPSAHRVAEITDIHEHSLDLDASNEAAIRGGRGTGGAAQVWRAASLKAAYNLSSVSSPAAWSRWTHALLRDDGAFGRLMSPQQCADEIESDYAVCKASMLCAMLEAEPAPYAACLAAVRKGAVRPRGWQAAVKRKP